MEWNQWRELTYIAIRTANRFIRLAYRIGTGAGAGACPIMVASHGRWLRTAQCTRLVASAASSICYWRPGGFPKSSKSSGHNGKSKKLQSRSVKEDGSSSYTND